MNDDKSYAGKSEPPDAGERISRLAADLVVSGYSASNAQDVERRKKEAEQKLLVFACDEIERHMKRNSSALPDYGGDDAGVVWRSISEDTSWLDGRDVVLLAHDMEVQARYCPGEWADETPNTPREYSGAVWSCFDDQFQLKIEECSKDPSEWGHDGATHWRPVSALSKPAPVAAEDEDYELGKRDGYEDAIATSRVNNAS